MQPKKEEESPIEPKEALSTTGGPPEKGATSPSAPALLPKPAASSNNVERGQTDKSEPQSTHRDVVSEKEQEETRKEEEEEEHEAGEKKGAPTVTTATFSSRGEPKGPPQACLFVASLSSQATEEVLHQHFSQYGEVLKIKIMRDPASRPYAFVQFKRVEDANAALLSSNDQVLQGRRLRVEKAKVNRTLFIAKMSRSLTAQKLGEIVEPFGPIESVTIIKNHQTQKSKGCGFVKFEFREDAMEAFLSMKQTHRRWVIEWATSTNESELMTGVDKHNIFVGGLNPTQITKELLQERFEGYGPIESISLVKKDEGEEPETGIPRSAFAFVRFKDASSSASAIEQENGTEWLGKRIRVQYCESADMKGRRRLHQMPGASPYTMGMMVAPPVPAANAYLQGGTHYFTYPPATSFAPAPPPMIIPQQMGGNVPLYIPPSQPTNMPPPPTAPSTPLHKFHPYNRKFFAAQTGEVVPNYSYPTSSATSSTPTSTISPTTGVGGTPSSSSGGISYSGDSSGGGYQMGYTHPTYAPYSTTTMYMAPPTTSFSDSSSTGQAVSSTSSLLSSDDYHHLQQQQQQGFVEFDAMYSSSISSTSSGNVEGGGYQLMTEQHQQQQQSMYHQLMPPPLYYPMPPPTAAQITTTGFPSEYQFHAGGMNAGLQQQPPPPEKEGRTGDRTSSSIPSSSSSSSSSSTAPPTSSFAQLTLKENTSSSTNTSDNKSLSPVQSPNHSTKGLPC